jgi:hypothetical protein
MNDALHRTAIEIVDPDMGIQVSGVGCQDHLYQCSLFSRHMKPAADPA